MAGGGKWGGSSGGSGLGGIHGGRLGGGEGGRCGGGQGGLGGRGGLGGGSGGGVGGGEGGGGSGGGGSGFKPGGNLHTSCQRLASKATIAPGSGSRIRIGSEVFAIFFSFPNSSVKTMDVTPSPVSELTLCTFVSNAVTTLPIAPHASATVLASAI